MHVEKGQKLADSGKLNGKGLKHCQGNIQVSPENISAQWDHHRKMRGGDPGKGGKKTTVASDRQTSSTGLS